MRKLIVVSLVLLASAALVYAKGKPADTVAGAWKFTYDNHGEKTTGSLWLARHGDMVCGKYSYAGDSGFAGSVGGAMAGNQFTGKWMEGQNANEMKLAFDGGKLSGTFKDWDGEKKDYADVPYGAVFEAPSKGPKLAGTYQVESGSTRCTMTFAVKGKAFTALTKDPGEGDCGSMTGTVNGAWVVGDWTLGEESGHFLFIATDVKVDGKKTVHLLGDFGVKGDETYCFGGGTLSGNRLK